MSKISVLMPVFNTNEIFLRESIESILNQSFEDFEFIIINDGSTNNAEDVILSYKDKRINYQKNDTNLGLIKTLNKGLDLIQSTYIARMDADDISFPNRLAIQYDFMEKNQNIGVLGSWYERFPKKKINKPVSGNKFIKENMLIGSNVIAHPTVMIRTNVLKSNNIKYNPKALYVEDYDLWLNLINKTDFENINKVLLLYRKHKNSICNKNVINQNLNAQELMFKKQSKVFDINIENINTIFENLRKNNQITIKDLIVISNFVNKIKTKTKDLNYVCEYEINHIFAKYALKKCKKDFEFFKNLWNGSIKIFYER